MKDEQDCISNVNKAILELFRHGGGPVHINLETDSLGTFKTKCLPNFRTIKRVTPFSGEWPKIEAVKKIAVWIGSHKPFTRLESSALEQFVETHDAVVLVDSNLDMIAITCKRLVDGVIHDLIDKMV